MKSGNAWTRCAIPRGRRSRQHSRNLRCCGSQHDRGRAVGGVAAHYDPAGQPGKRPAIGVPLRAHVQTAGVLALARDAYQ